MQASYDPYMTAAKAPRSLGRMIREEEMRHTMRILNAARSPRRVGSYSERYRRAEDGASPASVAEKPTMRRRLVDLLHG